MKSPEKKTKSQRIVELERKLYESSSYHSYRHHLASRALDNLSTDRLMGSGVILSLTKVGGEKPFEPVMISGGLSKETIAALKADLARSFNYNIELKPEGA